MTVFLNFFCKQTIKGSSIIVFECGFDSLKAKISSSRFHFFKITIVFIIFDLEIIFLILIIKNQQASFLIYLIFLFLLGTILVEITAKSLT